MPDVPQSEFTERPASGDASKSTRTTRSAARGSQCVECHMPKIEQTIADVNVRSHSFKFITPSMSEQYKIPNPCTMCHTSQTTEWAKGHLKNWSGVSPWRVQ